MKILQINSFFSVGGPPRIMNGIHDMLKREGIECKIAASREQQYDAVNSIQIGSKIDVYLNAIKARLFDNEGFNAKKSTQKLIKEIEEYNPDLIHLHNLHGYYINVEELFDYLKIYGKPVVWTLHDCWPITGHCPHFSMAKCNNWISGCHDCPQKREYPKSVFMDNSPQNWKRKKNAFTKVSNMTIVCVSKWLQNIVKKSYLSQYNTRVIYNGIDLTPFKSVESSFRRRYGLEDKKILVGVAMHWLPRKGLNDYVELSKIIGMDTVIVLVGLTDEQSTSMPPNIIGISATTDDQNLAEIYSSADICLNLSYEETFGLTSVEALACGTPIITYDQTAVPEIAEMFGMPVVKAGDIQALSRIISETPRKEHSIKTDLSCFEQENQYRKYIELYRKLV